MSVIDTLSGFPTGTIGANDCGLYVQTYFGFYHSKDQGVTWQKVGDVGSFQGSQFYLQENVAIVQKYGDGKGPDELWRYVEPTELTLPSIVLAGCEIDTHATLHYNADCFSGELISAEIVQDGTRFTLGDVTLPQAVSGEFEIPFSYSSLQNGATDEATMKLRFRAGAYTFDTIIAIVAQAGSGATYVGFVARATNASPMRGDKTTIAIYPTASASNVALNEVSFDVAYHDDLFRFETVRSSEQVDIGATQVNNGRITLPITISGNDITLDPNVPIAEIELTAMLTDTTTTDVTISNVKLNGGDQDYARCKLALSETEGTALTVQLQCGDPLMQRVMRGEKALEIRRVSPNPTNERVTIEWEARVAGEVKLEVYSVAGVLLHEEVVAQAGKPITLDTRSWPSGAYTIRLRSGEEEAVASVIKN